MTRAEFVSQLVAEHGLRCTFPAGQTLLSGSTTTGWEARRGRITARGRTVREALDALAVRLPAA